MTVDVNCTICIYVATAVDLPKAEWSTEVFLTHWCNLVFEEIRNMIVQQCWQFGETRGGGHDTSAFRGQQITLMWGVKVLCPPLIPTQGQVNQSASCYNEPGQQGVTYCIDEDRLETDWPWKISYSGEHSWPRFTEGIHSQQGLVLWWSAVTRGCR